MSRRIFFTLVITALLLACLPTITIPVATQPAAPTYTSVPPTAKPAFPTITTEPLLFTTPTITNSQDYDVRNSLTITNLGPGRASKLEIKIAVILDHPPTQDVLSFEATPGEMLPRIVDDFGNEFAVFEFYDIDPWESVTVAFHYQIRVYELHYAWSACQGEVIDAYLQPVTYIESNDPQIVALAAQLGQGLDTLCAKTRAYYDYVTSNLTYLAYNPGDLGALWALSEGGGDCTEFSDVFIALNRAGGIPARFLEGVVYYLGEYSEGDVKHDWSEVYWPGIGWAPMDATWGRHWEDRETYFAGMSADHIVVTRGRNLEPLEGGHFYLWNYWLESLATEMRDDEFWSVSKVEH
ncbi:MAG TPA: transglutaminase domain-containing protein [Anaerolineae bacterium]|nr:transglutaminase domain-containing protein [Anaerolineae bacterium]